MFDFIKRLFKKLNSVEEQEKPQQVIPFSNVADEKTSQAVWREIWSNVLKIDQCANHIDSKILADIEQRIKLGIIQGHGSRQAATELQPLFESIGLTRRDALNLVTLANKLVQEKQASPDINCVVKDEVEETPEQIVRRARIEYVKIAKCCFK